MPAARRKTPKARNPRDVTKALNLLLEETILIVHQDARGNATTYYALRAEPRSALVKILTDIDARETKRDPHLRRKT